MAELARRGFEAVPEPGRKVVAEEQRGEGNALPWIDLEAFARRVIEIASCDRERMRGAQGWVFFDRGLVDAAVALEHATGVTASDTLGEMDHYHRQVFLTPPWPEIFSKDGERPHNLDEALSEYDRLLTAYKDLGYETIIVPKATVEARADFLLDCLR